MGNALRNKLSPPLIQVVEEGLIVPSEGPIPCYFVTSPKDLPIKHLMNMLLIKPDKPFPTKMEADQLPDCEELRIWFLESCINVKHIPGRMEVDIPRFPTVGKLKIYVS